MVSLLLSLALLFGAYEGTCESVESTPMQVECVAHDVVVDVPAPELPVAAATTRARHREAAHRPTPQLTRIFRPPRS